MKRRFHDFLSWLYTSAPGLRNLTGTEASAAVQRFSAVIPVTVFTENHVNITIDNFYDEAQFLVRLNGLVPDKIDGGTLTHLTGGLYLLSADEPTIDIIVIQE